LIQIKSDRLLVNTLGSNRYLMLLARQQSGCISAKAENTSEPLLAELSLDVRLAGDAGVRLQWVRGRLRKAMLIWLNGW